MSQGGAIAVLAACLPSGCAAPEGTCVYYIGGAATPECSEFNPGQVVARVVARPGESVAEARDRAFAALAGWGLETSSLSGKLGWGLTFEPLPEDVVLGGGSEEPLQVTSGAELPYEELLEGGETVAFFFLEILAVVATDDGETYAEAAEAAGVGGELVILRAGRVIAGALGQDTAQVGDEVVVF